MQTNIKTTFFLDTRRPDKNGLYTLYIVLAKNSTRATLSTGLTLSIDQWCDNMVVNHPQKDYWNGFLYAKKGNIDRAINELSFSGAFVNKSAKETLQIVRERIDPGFAAKANEAKRKSELERNGFARIFQRHMATIKNNGTKGLYADTYKKLERFCVTRDIEFASLTFEDIDIQWLKAFENYCLTTQKQNSASRHLRDIRAVFNAAIDEGVTAKYPFRKYKIKREETFDKSFTAAELRTLFEYECYEGWQREAIDMFKLMFCLIGINSVDLANASDLDRGRLNYVRVKTHKPYSIKIEPEALAIINCYKGEHGKLVNILNRFGNYKTYFNRLGKTLRKVGLERIPGKKSSGKPLLPDICTGSARTSWATIAQEELDIPREVIAAALGHHTIDVTSTYLRTDWKRKVDDANRKVLDWVLHKNRSG